MTRNDLKNKIYNALSLFDINPESIRGSFKGSDFHFIESKRVTFSDIDLMINRHTLPSDIHKQVEGEILRTTGIHIPVSIHKKDCLYEMTLRESQDLAILECIYQSTNNKFNDPVYQLYIRCKFAILISRVSTKESYNDVISRLNCDDSDRWFNIKCGTTLRAEIHKFDNWPTVGGVNAFWYNFFHGNKESISQLSIYYHSVVNKTTLPLSLIKRIDEKLLSNGISFNDQ